MRMSTEVAVWAQAGSGSNAGGLERTEVLELELRRLELAAGSDLLG